MGTRVGIATLTLTLASLVAVAACGGDDTGLGPTDDGGSDATMDGSKADSGTTHDTGSAHDTGSMPDTAGNPDTGGTPDTGANPDTGTPDTGIADTGIVDTGVADTGAADTGAADTGVADTGTADTGAADTGVADTGSDGGTCDLYGYSFGSAACDMCVGSNCCTETAACFAPNADGGANECANLVECVLACEAEGGTQIACATGPCAAYLGAAAQAMTFQACVQMSCQNDAGNHTCSM